jgi:hypothetical protein
MKSIILLLSALAGLSWLPFAATSTADTASTTLGSGKSIIATITNINDSQPIQGAKVTVLQADKQVQSAASDAKGTAQLSLRANATLYQLVIAAKGFETLKIQSIVLADTTTEYWVFNLRPAIFDDQYTSCDWNRYKFTKRVANGGTAPGVADDMDAPVAYRLESRSVAPAAAYSAPASEPMAAPMPSEKRSMGGSGGGPGSVKKTSGVVGSREGSLTPIDYSTAPGAPASPSTPSAITTVPSVDDGTVRIGRGRSSGTDYYIDGVRVSGSVPPVKDIEELDAVMGGLGAEYGDVSEKPVVTPAKKDVKPDSDPTTTEPKRKPAPKPRAGLLTAGEWNDLDNWSKHWTDLLTDGEIETFQRQYACYPRHRYTVILQNEQQVPIVDATVELTDASGAIWKAHTDNTGKCELWYQFFEAQKGAATPEFRVRATVGKKTHDLGIAKPFEQGLNVYQIRSLCAMPQHVDIMWVVDATGSMGDEIQYLKSELLDVIGRVKSANPALTVRMGSMFYRDHGDDYVIKSTGLHSDIRRSVEYISQQNAGGGGDQPEAIDEALEDAIMNQSWSESAVARICFVVLDASPHNSPEINARLHNTMKMAAEKGIRIVPVTASGILTDTEFLMKFMGLATNGTYVFLTNHSGIGDKHIAPTADVYSIELLNDLLVRLITQYTTVPTCEGQSLVRFESTQDSTQQQQALAPVQYYPNPASTHIMVDLPFDAQKVTLYNAEGQAVHQVERPVTGQHRIPLEQVPAGFYTLRIWKDNQVQAGKVIVIKAQ